MSDSILSEINKVGERVSEELELDECLAEEVSDWQKSNGLEDHPDADVVTSQLSAFNYLLKATLYQIYQKSEPELETIEDVDEVQKKLRRAHEVTNDNAFKTFVLDKIVNQVEPEIFEPLLGYRGSLSEDEEAYETIGHIYESIVDQKARRNLGQFRTPGYMAEVMAEWAIQNADARVLDPGTGAGVLAAHVYQIKKNTEPGDTAHVDDIYGVDVSQLAIVMTATSLKIANGADSPNLFCDDFIDTIVEGSNTSIDKMNPTVIPKMDAVVSNPPYSRGKLLEEEKDRINKKAERYTGKDVSKRAPLYHYFYIHATRFVREGGRVAFVTPDQFLETNYGEQLKQFLLDNYAIHGVVLHESEEGGFADARTDPCIMFLERSESQECETSIMNVEDWSETSDILSAIEGGDEGHTEYGYINRLSQKQLDSGENWANYADPSDVDSLPDLKRLNEIATIKRGIATGMNDFFCLSESEVEERELNKEHLTKIIRQTNGSWHYDLIEEDWEEMREEDEEVWLLYYEEDELEDKALSEYLEYGKEMGANERYLTSQRGTWYSVETREEPQILGNYMSKKGFRFMRNRAGVRTLNNIHNIYLDETDYEYSDEEIDALLAYLNSTISVEIMKRSGRTYSGGLHKIEPGEVKKIPVLDPKDLAHEEVERLSGLYQDLCEAAREGEEKRKEVLLRLDRGIIRIIESKYDDIQLVDGKLG
jgi:tRNA1(Val) A37 N6-methylase TrmN6